MIIKKDTIFQIQGNRYTSKAMKALQDIDVAAFLEENALSDFWEVPVEMLGGLAEAFPIVDVNIEEVWETWAHDEGDDPEEYKGWRLRLQE